ncbi:hypothetical protein [Streptomyces sp. P17]|uniref:hypothetical protein n=1 Tax=Streptomyces sp. P17 TaxID=3074716 RepID=UPI0028F453BC|nr:hypothetical protein [Streptomyces sp. P17]MDT9698559.1 hypothetical protein [Streptomyces sp. P17]
MAVLGDAGYGADGRAFGDMLMAMRESAVISVARIAGKVSPYRNIDGQPMMSMLLPATPWSLR